MNYDNQLYEYNFNASIPSSQQRSFNIPPLVNVRLEFIITGTEVPISPPLVGAYYGSTHPPINLITAGVGSITQYLTAPLGSADLFTAYLLDLFPGASTNISYNLRIQGILIPRIVTGTR